RVVEKYFSYIGKYASGAAIAATPKAANTSTKAQPKAPAANPEEQRQAHDIAIALIRPYVERGETLEQIRKSYLGSSNNTGSAQVRSNKIIVDKIGNVAVNYSFSLSILFNEIKGGKKAASAQTKSKRIAKPKDISTLPEPKQVISIPTSTAFIKRYAALHGKVKTRDQIVSLIHGLQKAITEQRIKTGNPALREIEKMQAELITLATTMGESAKIEIDAPSLAHYKQIAQGEEVRTSVRLLKSFISMNGKAYDKVKAVALHKKMEKALDTIPKEDAYLSQLSVAAKALAAYGEGKDKTIAIPSAALHGLGSIATGHGTAGLGIVPSSGEGAIIRLLREEGVKNLSQATLKKAFRKTVVPSLCLEIARNLIRRGELTMEVLNNPALKKKSFALGGVDSVQSLSGRITDLDILELRLNNANRNITPVAGLGNVEAERSPQIQRAVETSPKSTALQREGQIMSVEALKTTKFETIGLTGKWKALIGDPAPGFSAMVYGLPKQGKSTFCLQLANDLAKHGQVLYCALEEGFGATLAEKLNRLGISANALQFADQIPHDDLRRYKFVFIDSVSEAGLDADGLRELRKANPGTAFIFVYHSTKAGNFRGSNTDAHDVDVIIEVKNGVASARGRYSPPAEMGI
ncbi:MAG: AAA family ATPase, partial [Bacteroidetes bacterium]|nr:AAA family ATPase [Bacteroidota bacterium]